jgi:hypothetical protein
MTDLGSLRIDGDRCGLRFERVYDTTPDDLWSALTEPERLARWLAPGDDGTMLVLDHRQLGIDQAPGYGAGWHAHLDALDDLLRGTTGSWHERFQAQLPAYGEMAARARAMRTSDESVSMS